jgi:mRNA-degrading endonuclease YafQ of YafQ-DinJ toxin-antitoxin module
MLMLGLFKFLLKVVRLLGDRGQNHFQLSNWQEYQQCRLHQDFLLSITTTSEQYEKEYLEFIRHNDIKVIRAVNRKFPELSHNAPLTARFYDNFRAFLAGVLQEHAREVNALALHEADPLNDRYEAFFAAASLLKMAETRSTNPLVPVPPDRTLLQDYTLSKRTKNDFLSGRRTLKSI